MIETSKYFLTHNIYCNMPLYKYAPVVVVTALLFLSTFDSCDAGDIRLNKKRACERSTQYEGMEEWQTFLTMRCRRSIYNLNSTRKQWSNLPVMMLKCQLFKQILAMKTRIAGGAKLDRSHQCLIREANRNNRPTSIMKLTAFWTSNATEPARAVSK